jgi:tetratricopeptide (TPR) repeat protein
MKQLIFIIAVFSLVALSACEDFLNLAPTTAAPAETAIRTEADAKVIINGLMRSLTSSNYYGRNFFLYGDVKGGDVAVVSLGRGNDALYTFNHSATSNSYVAYWSQIYFCMLQINNLLANIDRMEEDGKNSATLSDYKGQALTLRALLYFDLVRLYGRPYTEDNGASLGVPMPLTVLDVYAQETRPTVVGNYTQILKDLAAAAPLLSKSVTKGFVNYYANKAIQARVYLFMGNHSEALKAAEEVINDNKYKLYENSAWVSSWSSEFGTESILELGIYQDEADLTSSSLGYYFMRRAKVSNAMGWFVASDAFIAKLAEDPADVRHGIMDYDEIANTRFGACNKYTGNDNKGDKGSPSAVNIKVIRLSEIYLIAAEAAFPSDKAKAVGYLNQIRKRAPSLTPATEATINLDMILYERSKELYMEGHKFFDMMRLGRSITFNDEILSGSISSTLRPKTIDVKTFNKTILPIAQAELDANPAIASQQNPGY